MSSPDWWEQLTPAERNKAENIRKRAAELARKKKRSDAAKKAWETIRRNKAEKLKKKKYYSIDD